MVKLLQKKTKNKNKIKRKIDLIFQMFFFQ